MRKITMEDALRALNEAVAMRGPEYLDEDAQVGNTCRNVVEVDGTWVPSCIVGTALVWLGVPVEWFKKALCVSNSIGTVSVRLRTDEIMDIPEPVVRFLGEAQSAQDQKQSWGDAVAVAHLGWHAFSNLEPRQIPAP